MSSYVRPQNFPNFSSLDLRKSLRRGYCRKKMNHFHWWNERYIVG